MFCLDASHSSALAVAFLCPRPSGPSSLLLVGEGGEGEDEQNRESDQSSESHVRFLTRSA